MHRNRRGLVHPLSGSSASNIHPARTARVQAAGDSAASTQQFNQFFRDPANRDPREFAEPDEFRLGRRSGRHVAFGSGLHRCLGAHYAQLEFEIILTTVLRRMPDFRIDAERAYKYDNIGLVDGWVTLPATFTPGPKVGAVVPGIGPA